MKAILCVDKKFGIGRNNDLLFSLPSDMKFFRQMTKDKVVVVGENTLRSFPSEKPLKNRINIVISENLERDDCIIVRSKAALFEEIKKYDTDSVFVIGGASVYNMMFPYCESVYVTKVDADGNADRFVTNLDEADFEARAISDKMEENGLSFTFYEYVNKNIKELD